LAESEAVSPEDKQKADLLLLGCVGAICLGIFGKFAMDFAGIVKARKRGTTWSYNPPQSPNFEYHPPPDATPKTPDQ
jgi:hypothetical protein